MTSTQYDVIVIGAGQSGLACGYYLKRSKMKFLILDRQHYCGGAWQHAWDSLNLFSPAEHSSLPGWLMPGTEEDLPDKDHVVDYLCRYERRYKIPVERPVNVINIAKNSSGFTLETNRASYNSKTIISATGTFDHPFIPQVPGREKFKGHQLHSAEYKNPDEYNNKKVLVAGEGNSAAQILAEVSKITTTRWATLKDPAFLPDDVDGRVLFDLASAKYRAKKEGRQFDPSAYNLGDIVMVPSVKEARERGALQTSGTIDSIFEEGVIWEDKRSEKLDVIIWCTGFNYETAHLKQLLNPDDKGKVFTRQTKSRDVAGIWLVGYGGWTGYASATLIGVGRTARQTVKEIEAYLDS